MFLNIQFNPMKAVKNAASTAATAVGDFAGRRVTNVKDGCSAVKAAASRGFTAVGSFFSKIGSGIKSGFTATVNKLSTATTAVATAVAECFKRVFSREAKKDAPVVAQQEEAPAPVAQQEEAPAPVVALRRSPRNHPGSQ